MASGPHPGVVILREVLCFMSEIAERLRDTLALLLVKPGFFSIPEDKKSCLSVWWHRCNTPPLQNNPNRLFW